MAIIPIKNILGYFDFLISKGVTISSVNSNGEVAPTGLQPQADVLLSTFDDSDKNESARLAKIKAQTVKAQLNDPTSDVFQIALALGLSISAEITKAVPTYVPLTVTTAQAVISKGVDDANK